jgi:hypothetical protein
MPVDEEEQLAVGAIKVSSQERKRIAANSHGYKCQECGLSLGEIAAQHLLEPNEEQQTKLLSKGPPSDSEKLQYQLREGEQLQKDLEQIEQEKLEYLTSQQEKIAALRQELALRKEAS